MSRRVAVLIGVSAAGGGLAPLPGVVNGIAEFAAWARSQEFDVVEVTDFDGAPVHTDRVYGAVARAVRGDDLERLFVYFAGHGVTLGQGLDLWLLNNVHDNPNQAINVSLSARHAKRCGVPHVAFFADACRSPAGRQLLDLGGISIFPQRRGATNTQLDQFYATTSGDPSFEKAPDGVAESAFGIFTRCLMAGLRGEDDRAVAEVPGGKMPRAVLARSLRSYLDQSVRLLADEQIGVDQTPECIPVSDWQPHVLAWLPAAAPLPPPDVPLDLGSAGPPMLGFRFGRPPGTLESVPGGDVGFGDQRARLVRLQQRAAGTVGQLAARYGASLGRGRFETATGLTVIGAEVDLQAARDIGADAFVEGGHGHVRGRDTRHTQVALVPLLLPAGLRWAGAAILPGYTGTLTVDEDGVEHIEYLPTTAPSSLSTEQLRDVIRWAAAGARLGTFDPDVDDPLLQAALHRDHNPTLTLLSAYHYDRIGAVDAVEDLLIQLLRARRSVPLDLLLLADVTPDQARRLAGSSADPGPALVAPLFPLRAAGWALVEAADWLPVDQLVEARRQLAPSPWTTFRELPAQLLDALAGHLAPAHRSFTHEGSPG